MVTRFQALLKCPLTESKHFLTHTLSLLMKFGAMIVEVKISLMTFTVFLSALRIFHNVTHECQ